MTAPRILILTDESKTFEKMPRSNTFFDIYSGSFNAVKSFYKKLKEKGLDVELKVLLDSNLIADAFDELKSSSHVSISKFLSGINGYDTMIILLSKNKLLFFISEYKKNNADFRGDIFVVSAESVRSEINRVFSSKTKEIHFFKRVGVARLNRDYSNAIIHKIIKIKKEEVSDDSNTH